MSKKIVISFVACLLLALPAAAATVKIKQNATPLRAEASAASAALAQCQKGDVLELVDVASGWYKVRDPKSGKVGFVPIDAAELLPGSLPAAGGKSPAAGGAPGQGTPPGTAKPAPAARPGTAPARRWTDIGYLAVSGGYQAGSSGFSETFGFQQHLERATVTTEYPKKDGPTFDVGGGFRVWRNLAAGVSVSSVSRSTDGAVSGSIPHPFFFDAGRAIEGTAALKRTETAVHVQAAYVVPAGRRMLVTLSGGPSFFSVKQSLVQSVQFSESYPFDTATLSSAPTASASKSVTGFNAGLDVGYYFTGAVGAGMMVRYSGATLALPSHDATISTKVGGFQAAGGLRVRIPKPAPKKTPPKPPAPPKPVKK
jgi:hypothetical protein